jgi:hypothetical protein
VEVHEVAEAHLVNQAVYLLDCPSARQYVPDIEKATRKRGVFLPVEVVTGDASAPGSQHLLSDDGLRISEVVNLPGTVMIMEGSTSLI